MFKKLMKVCVLSAASIGVLFSFQGSTFAATDLSSYYDGKNPATTKVYGGSTTCDADGFNAKSTAVYEGSKKVGTVYLRYSNKCHAAWAKFVLDQPAPAVSGGVYAYAVVNKYKNG
ncbi:YjfA family protein, partial [Bacillus sp. ZZQ-131]